MYNVLIPCLEFQKAAVCMSSIQTAVVVVFKYPIMFTILLNNGQLLAEMSFLTPVEPNIF